MSDKKKQNKEPKNKITLAAATSQWNNLIGNGRIGENGLVSFFTKDPYIQNQRLKQIPTAPLFLDRDTLEGAVKNPGFSEQALRQMSWSLLSSTYPYYKMVKLYSDILTYKNYTYPKYVSHKGSIQKEQELIYRWVDKLQPERTFRRIAMDCCIEGKKAYILRDKIDRENKTVDYAILQDLPSNWWKPTYKSQDSYFGISFNFTYFWMPGTDVSQFPPIFTTYYKELMGCTEPGGNKINLEKVPAGMTAEFDSRLSKWYLWAELPSDIAWCFSMDETNAWQVPPFIGLFLSLQDLGSYQFLQTQLSSIPLYGILSGTIPLHDQNKGASTTDDLRLSPGLVKSLVDDAEAKLPPGVAAVFSPLENVKFDQFEQQVNSSKIFEDALQQEIATAGLTGLMSTTDKPSVSMVMASQKIESRYSDVLYGQFEKFMDVVLESRLSLKNGWKFEIFGNIFEDAKDVAALESQILMGQSYLLPKVLAYRNLDMISANSISDWVESSGIYNKMKLVPNAFTSSGSGETGRPELELEDIENDETAKSADSGLNKEDSRERYE